MYYYPSTLPSGSGDPLRPHKQVRSLLRTGWGPRGDSGSARGRVRATQPAIFHFSASLDYFQAETTPIEGLRKALFFFCIHRQPACNLGQTCPEIS
jgi:hypothetical protein